MIGQYLDCRPDHKDQEHDTSGCNEQDRGQAGGTGDGSDVAVPRGGDGHRRVIERIHKTDLVAGGRIGVPVAIHPGNHGYEEHQQDCKTNAAHHCGQWRPLTARNANEVRGGG